MNLEALVIPEEAKTASQSLKPNSLSFKLFEGEELLESNLMSMVPSTQTSDLTFLFLHGAAFTSSDWEDLGTLSLLGALGFKTLAVDLPGTTHLLLISALFFLCVTYLFLCRIWQNPQKTVLL